MSSSSQYSSSSNCRIPRYPRSTASIPRPGAVSVGRCHMPYPRSYLQTASTNGRSEPRGVLIGRR